LQGKVSSAIIATLVLAVSGVGKVVAYDEDTLKQALIADCQKQIVRTFQPPYIREHNKQLSNPNNLAIVQFNLFKDCADGFAKDVVCIKAKGDPEFAKAAEETIRMPLFRPNGTAKDPLSLECTFTEKEIIVHALPSTK
jgi:hypothetical protein